MSSAARSAAHGAENAVPRKARLPGDRRSRSSLAWRMGLISAASIFAILAIVGVALERFITSYERDEFDAELVALVDQVVAVHETSPVTGEVTIGDVGQFEFLVPGSGYYWQLTNGRSEPQTSRSLWTDPLELQGIEQALSATALSDEKQLYDIDYLGDNLRVGQRTIVPVGANERYTFAVAINTAERDRQIERIRGALFASFVFIALGFLLMTLFQIFYGLSPLRRVRAAIQKLRTHGENRITDPLPTEVQPLVDEVNALLEHTEQQAEEARTHAGNLAHALKTPLTVLTNSARANEDNLGETVFRETRAMQRHVDHHLARARAAGRRAHGQARANVWQSAEAVRRAVERLYPEGRLDVAGRRDAEASIERQDLDEILGNLIENAAKYGGGSVFVTVDAVPGSEMCHIWIEDDGSGIPEAERSRIFERGARLDTGKPGTGLGLAIVRDVVAIYGGTAMIGESEDLGGLWVELCLPRA